MSLEKIAVSTDFQNFNFYKAPGATAAAAYLYRNIRVLKYLI